MGGEIQADSGGEKAECDEVFDGHARGEEGDQGHGEDEKGRAGGDDEPGLLRGVTGQRLQELGHEDG